MTGSLYRIKLYGQSGDDPEAFTQSLAALLGMALPEASALLEQTPVVIRENLTREEAEKLKEIIGVMKGLCLVEPMDGAAPGLAVPSPAKAPEAAREPLLKLGTRTMAWLALGGFLLIVFFAAAFLMAPKGTVRDRGATKFPRGKARPAPATTAQAPSGQAWEGPGAEALQQQAAAIEKEIPQLKKELMQVYRSQQAASSGPNRNPQLAKENFLRTFEIKDEIRVKQHRLRAIRSRLNSMKMKSGVKAPAAGE